MKDSHHLWNCSLKTAAKSWCRCSHFHLGSAIKFTMEMNTASSKGHLAISRSLLCYNGAPHSNYAGQTPREGGGGRLWTSRPVFQSSSAAGTPITLPSISISPSRRLGWGKRVLPLARSFPSKDKYSHELVLIVCFLIIDLDHLIKIFMLFMTDFNQMIFIIYTYKRIF